jgi:hypothetical protein
MTDLEKVREEDIEHERFNMEVFGTGGVPRA